MPVWGVVALIGCVIVPIIVLLVFAAILFPMLSRGRERARGIVCLSHSQKIGMATLLYAQDYDDVLPPKNSAWIDLLEPYTKSTGVEMTAPTKQPTVVSVPLP
ncbi:MAG: hypothetical protein QM758_24945 [Armatimonas sp.]